MPLGEEKLPLFHILTDLDHILARCDRAVDLNGRGIHHLGVLHDDHGIGPLRDHPSRRDAHHFPRTGLYRGRLSHGDLPNEF